MFGYVKPYKPELTFREWARYRSVYCGLCKSLSKHYGQIPRLTVTYDVTFWLLLIEALVQAEPSIQEERCLAHPIQSHLIEQDQDILELGACLSVLLAQEKCYDDLADGDHPYRATMALSMTKKARQKATRRSPEMAETLAEGLDILEQLERDGAEIDVQAFQFGQVLSEAMSKFLQALGQKWAELVPLSDTLLQLALYLGAWVFLVDALDDFEKDQKRAKSLLAFDSFEEAYKQLSERLELLESKLEQLASSLPYQRDAALVANIVLDGLVAERQSLVERRKH